MKRQNGSCSYRLVELDKRSGLKVVVRSRKGGPMDTQGWLRCVWM